jgi:atypical dual specificity phosphatase
MPDMSAHPGLASLAVVVAATMVSCGLSDAPDYAVGDPAGMPDGDGPVIVAQDDDDSSMPSGFSWVIDGQLAGMARPGSRQSLDQDLSDLYREGVRVLVSLTEEPPPPADVAAHGIVLLHVPVQDFTAPTQDQLASIMARLDEALADDRPVTVHCGAGLGRTGTVLAVAFVHRLGMDAVTAIAEIRRLRPGSIETPEQEQAVWLYATNHPQTTDGAPSEREY